MKSLRHLFYNPTQLDYSKGYDETSKIEEGNWKQIKDSDAKGRNVGTILGRYYQESRGDGYAVYIITKLNKKSCVLEWCDQIGDDWMIPTIGAMGTANIDYIVSCVNSRDKLNELFGRKNL